MDAKGNPIVGAKVAAACDEGDSASVTTDADGKYGIGFEGHCHVSVSAAGFETFVEKQVRYSRIRCCLNIHADFNLLPIIVVYASQAAKANWEYGAFVQGGVGLEERTDFSFVSAGGQLGRRLTGELGPGLLKGDFEYAVQVIPLWESYTPKFQRLNCPVGATVASQCYGPTTSGGTYRGASIEPIILRWNFTKGKRLMPWVQAAGGVVYTTRKYPGVGDLNVADPTQTGPAADTSVWNFTPQGGIGAHYFLKPSRSVDMSVNGVHISSSSLGDKNPGVNVSLQLSVGYTWWK
jgi:hypothetical protein